MKSHQVLFIDGQVFQSAAWDRGMGKYSLALLKALRQNTGYQYDKTYIIFTKNMPLDPAAEALISAALPGAEQLYADLKVPADPSLANIPDLQEANEALLATVIDDNTQPTDSCTYFILSLFIDQVCSVFPAACKKVLLFYDLIPLQYNERYGLLSSYNNYLARYKTLFEADTILAISQTVADDVALNLGISQAKICNINGAPIERVASSAKKPAIDMGQKFVLMPSGNDIRKNNVRAVQGFEAYLRDAEVTDMVLVLTSFFDEQTRQALLAYSPHIVFTGNVSEEELRWLYENALALLFVSEYEGLGLPILEAAEVNKPIVCSNLTVFNEISPTAFYYSDPFDPLSIAVALKQALESVGLSAKVAQYPEILRRYTWERTAEDTVRALALPAPAIKQAKQRLAVMTPSPAGYSAIGKLVMQLHPALAEHYDIDYYVEGGRTHKDFSRPNYLPHIATVYPASLFTHKRYEQYDAVLYHIGNSEFHMDTIKSALHLPGYAIFHDTHLANIFQGEMLEYGYVTENRLAAEKVLDAKIGNEHAEYISSIVNAQLGLIGHSEYTKLALQASTVAAIATTRLNLPTAVPAQLKPRAAGAPLTIGLAGIIHPAKGLAMVEELAQQDEFYNCNFHIFGLSLVSDEDIRRLSGYANVQVDTNITDFQFQQMLSQLDVLINYRPDYRGETSLATIEAMRFGVIPIVRNIGWYGELPDDAVIKATNQKQVAEKLSQLIADQEVRSAMQLAASRYISEHHSYEEYAKALHTVMTKTVAAANPNAKIAQALKSAVPPSELKRLLTKPY